MSCHGPNQREQMHSFDRQTGTRGPFFPDAAQQQTTLQKRAALTTDLYLDPHLDGWIQLADESVPDAPTF